MNLEYWIKIIIPLTVGLSCILYSKPKPVRRFPNRQFRRRKPAGLIFWLGMGVVLITSLDVIVEATK